MCTLIVLRNVVPDQSLVVASNRDEFFARHSAPPAVVSSGAPEGGAVGARFVAPQDLEAGGTWMGLNEAGVFVGLTNRRDPSAGSPARPAPPSPPPERSRGLLVRDLLGLPSADAARRAIDALADAPRYSPFHLVCADPQSGFVATQRGGRAVSVEPLESGAHVICNRDASDPSSRKVETLRERLARISLDGPVRRVVDSLGQLLSQHAGPRGSLEGPCVHLDDYGTRSSTILAISESRWQGWHAEGAPCQTKYQNLTRLLDEIRQAPPSQGKVK